VRCREGGPIDHSIVRAGFTVASDVVRCADSIGGVIDALIQTFLPVVTSMMVKECLEVFPAMCTSLMPWDRKDTGRDMLSREKVPDLR
jgi:hypothetical protein